MKKMTKILIGAALTIALSSGALVLPARASVASAERATVQIAEQTAKTEKSQENLQIRAKSAYLADYATGTVMFAQNEKDHLPIASMCKIMTLILSFDAIKAGSLTVEESLTVSERAAAMGGSQVFLEANAKYPVKELIKSIVVCSANDSCVAIAEKIAGSEAVFTERMNEKAKALGANDTLFSNCTGLPKEPQYSCAKDVAIMLKELLSNEEYYEFGKVWLDKFNHPKGRYTEITNTNKLVRFYDGCDGGKTGFTNQAGFCLAATAKRADTRVISVVIGEETSQNRFDDVRTMFDYAFANYVTTPIVEANVPLDTSAFVNGGKEKKLEIAPERSCYTFSKRSEKANVTIETELEDLRAPIRRGDRVGELVIYKDNVETDRVALVAMQDVQKANFFDRFRDVARDWNAR